MRCERWRGPSKDGGPIVAIGRTGPSEGVRNCRDRVTAPIEDIWREKIRRCSYRGGNTSRDCGASYYSGVCAT